MSTFTLEWHTGTSLRHYWSNQWVITLGKKKLSNHKHDRRNPGGGERETGSLNTEIFWNLMKSYSKHTINKMRRQTVTWDNGFQKQMTKATQLLFPEACLIAMLASANGGDKEWYPSSKVTSSLDTKGKWVPGHLGKVHEQRKTTKTETAPTASLRRSCCTLGWCCSFSVCPHDYFASIHRKSICDSFGVTVCRVTQSHTVIFMCIRVWKIIIR